jgi:hypothetical protein
MYIINHQQQRQIQNARLKSLTKMFFHDKMYTQSSKTTTLLRIAAILESILKNFNSIGLGAPCFPGIL